MAVKKEGRIVKNGATEFPVIVEKSVSSVEVRFGPKQSECTIKVYHDDIEEAEKKALAVLTRIVPKLAKIDEKHRN